MSGKAVELRGVDHWFYRRAGGELLPVMALDAIDLAIRATEFVAIVGPSGCGKTTILNMVAGLLEPSAGEVKLGEGRPNIGDPAVGYMLARDGLLAWRSAIDNVSLPLELRGMPRRERRERAMAGLQAVGLSDFIDAYPAQLSHGMRQRVALARTLVTEPTTLLMDEPFAALDAQTRLVLQEQFSTLWQRLRSTVLLVTHDLAEAVLLADRVVVLSGRPGRIKGDFNIELGRPRRIAELLGTAEYHAMFQKVWSVFRNEVGAG